MARLKGIEIDEKRVVSSDTAIALDKVPERLLVIGAGVIGLELGSVWRRLGSKVTVVEFLDGVLPGMDGEVRKQAQRLFEKQGITFKLSSKVTGVDASGKTLKAKVEPAKGGAAETIEADVVLVAVGRTPYTEGLGLEEAGVKKDERGRVAVDKHFATNVKGIYAIGDVIAGPMLAHKAEDEGVAVAEILAGQAGHVNYDVIPSVVYTYPEIASVGKSEEELKAGGRRLQRRQVSLHRQWPRQGQSHHRRLCEDPGRCQDRPRARRAYRRRRCRQHDRGSRGGDGIRRRGGRHRAHLPRASDLARGGEGSRDGRRQARDPYVSLVTSLPGLIRQSISSQALLMDPRVKPAGDEGATPADARSIDLEQPLAVDLGIDLRRRQRGMAEQFLDRAQIAAARQEDAWRRNAAAHAAWRCRAGRAPRAAAPW